MIVQIANILDSSSLLLVLIPMLHPRCIASLALGTLMLPLKCMFEFVSVVIILHLRLFNFDPYLKPPSSLPLIDKLMVLLSVGKQVASSAYVTSSKSAPGVLCLSSLRLILECTSSNITVSTMRNRHWQDGQPCLIPVLGLPV